MKREIEQSLIEWKDSKDHLPIIMRGTRQVGKSYTIIKFANDYFEDSCVVNFELDEKVKDYFNSLDPQKIIEQLEIYFNKRIIPGKTLLFLDEIQNCPRAILALRYFKEKLPELHVISAGSLLEFTLKDSDFSFPVGRVRFMYLKPLSFREFLFNFKEELLLEKLEDISLTNLPSKALHDKLLEYLKIYMLTGGMPAVVNSYINTRTFLECKNIQASLVESYKNDFGKYSTSAQYNYLKKTFSRVPFLVCERLKYVKIDPEIRSRELKTSIKQLEYAGLISKIYLNSASGVPLRANIKEDFFKLLFLDVGLLQNILGVDPKNILDSDILQINKGVIAEQFVGQELRAYQDFNTNYNLCYWARDKKSSSAEVDYLLEINNEILPIEVKSGKTGRMKSLKIFMEEKKSKFGIKISEAPLSYDGNILSLPLYMIFELERNVMLLKNS